MASCSVAKTPQTKTPSVSQLFRPIAKATGQAVTDYQMIEQGDKIMVCLSGGKDSYTLLQVLLHLQQKAPISFEIVAVNLDQGQPNFPKEVLPQYLSDLGVDHTVISEDTYSIVKEKIPEGQTTCSLCSRLRRGILYAHAQKIGANKIALGHHRDDILQTFFMNMFFGARLKAMPPKLRSDDGSNIVIRPLAFVPETQIIAYAQAKAFPIIPCDLCGSQENMQRKIIGSMLNEWESAHPGRLNNILRALTRVTASHLLDSSLYDFMSLAETASSEGDKAFDPDSHPEHEFLVGLNEMQVLLR